MAAAGRGGVARLMAGSVADNRLRHGEIRGRFWVEISKKPR
jgi:hypothetical protein